MTSAKLSVLVIALVFGYVKAAATSQNELLDNLLPTGSGIDLTDISDVFGGQAKQSVRGLALFNQDYQARLNQLNVKVTPLRNRNAQLRRFAEATGNATIVCRERVPVNALTKLGGTYYLFEGRSGAGFTKTFQEANSVCRSHGMQLTTLETAAESTLVKNKVFEIMSTETPAPTVLTAVGFYIGLNDLALTSTYLWVGDGSTGTPEFANLAAGGTCARITLTTNPLSLANIAWLDAPCTDVQRYICELPKTCQFILNLPS